MGSKVSVAIFFRNPILMEGLSLIGRAHGFAVTRCSAAVSDVPSCDLVETDIILTDEGIELANLLEIGRCCPLTQVVILTDRIDALAAGLKATNVTSILLYSVGTELLIAKLKALVIGEPASSLAEAFEHGGAIDGNRDSIEQTGCVTMVSDRVSRRSVLSNREWQVLRFLSNGNTNREIAGRCGITEATVKVHLKAVLRKLAVENRTQAALWAINNGLVDATFGEEPGSDARSIGKKDGLVGYRYDACSETN